MAHAALAGSERSLTPHGKIVGRLDRHKQVRITVHVRASKDQQGEQLRAFVANVVGRRAKDRTHLSRADYATRFGASAEDFKQVRRFARQYGLRVVEDRVVRKTAANQAGHRSMELEGSVGALNKAFGVDLVKVREGKTTYRTYNGPISIPEQYQSVIENVFGLDTRPQVVPRFRAFPQLGGYNPHAQNVGFGADEVANLYNFPPSTTGAGQTVAIIELGGGFRRRDLETYFTTLGISMPAVRVVQVDGGFNDPSGDPNSADGEVMLDIEVAGTVAPGARFVLYFAPNTSRGFFRVLNAAVHDDRHKPSIVSVSWGGAESTWTLKDMQSIDEVCQAAVAMGISVFVAAGDDGSSDGIQGTLAHVDFPASSPNVTACGGTTLTASSDGATVASETVWNDGAQGGGTGGGISDVFPVPVYQTGPGIRLPTSLNPGAQPGRGVPDISGNADPMTGYKVRIDGIDTVIGGTSAVAPLWAGLIARINEGLGQPVGFVNTLLYSVVASTPGALRDITQGDNDTTGTLGGYPAGPGWDACTGLGAPADGTRIMNALK